MGYKNITIRADIVQLLNAVSTKSLIIYDDALIADIISQISNPNIVTTPISIIGKNYQAYVDIIGIYHDCEQVYGMGGGAAIDIAKYIAKLLRLPYIVIPTVLSNNSFATNKGVLLDNNEEVTIDCDNPTNIILDTEYLKGKSAYNILGYADILAMDTALYDWDLAAKHNHEIINPTIYAKAKNTLDSTINYLNNHNNVYNNIELLYNNLGTTGDITIAMGCGRACSGIEHIFAKKLETNISVPHGIAVAIGIVTGRVLQGRATSDIIKIFSALGYWQRTKQYNITTKLIIDTILSIKPRPTRYTILDEINASDFVPLITQIFDNILSPISD